MNELEQRIHAEIAEKGGIPFSRFMERALYEPGWAITKRNARWGAVATFTPA